MSEFKSDSETEASIEDYPVTPNYHPVHRLSRSIYDFLASAKLAMFLLVAILVACLVGVTLLRGERASSLIFEALWFNGLLVFLIINVACCFFGRIWGRKVTLVSFGMILFHLSFVSLFSGVVFNSLFYFRGMLRLTEGESLQNDDPKSYDSIAKGKYFRYSKLQGVTTLTKLLPGYKVDGNEKRVAFQVTVADRDARAEGVMYLTKNLTFKSVTLFPETAGYSLLTTLTDRKGTQLFNAFVPLQSLKRDKTIMYTSGTADGPGGFPLPQYPVKPVINMQVTYKPDPKKHRSGEASFHVTTVDDVGTIKPNAVYVDGTAAIGASFQAGDYTLSAKEVRYWSTMKVAYEPGKPIILTSLWVGLAGMIITTLGRMLRGRKTHYNLTLCS